MDSLITLLHYFARKKSDKIRFVLFVSLLGLILIFLIIGIYTSIYIHSQENNIQNAKRYIAFQSQKKRLLENYSDYSRTTDSIFLGMTEKWRQPDVVRSIDDYGKKNNVQVIKQNYKEIDRGSTHEDFEIDISAVGQYGDVKKFIHDLTWLRGRSLVTRMKITHADAGNVSLNIVLRTIYLKARVR